MPGVQKNTFTGPCLRRTACWAPRLVDEYKRIYTVILFIGKAIRRTHRGKGRRHGRMARRELFEFCRLGGTGFRYVA